MRDHDEDDPKKPQPVRILKKQSNPAEACEAVPCRRDEEHERYRHVA